jgi:hypothetical protein
MLRAFQRYLDYVLGHGHGDSEHVSLFTLCSPHSVELYTRDTSLSESAMSMFSDMRSVLHEYASLKGSASELNERLSLMCDKPAVTKMKQEARNAQRKHTKTTRSLTNQISVLQSDSKILPLSELVANTLAYCNRKWAQMKARVTAIKNEYNKGSVLLTSDERKQLAALFLTVHALTVKVERNCNMVSLTLEDGLKWLPLDVLIHTQNKPSLLCLCLHSSNQTLPA